MLICVSFSIGNLPTLGRNRRVISERNNYNRVDCAKADAATHFQKKFPLRHPQFAYKSSLHTLKITMCRLTKTLSASLKPILFKNNLKAPPDPKICTVQPSISCKQNGFETKSGTFKVVCGPKSYIL